MEGKDCKNEIFCNLFLFIKIFSLFLLNKEITIMRKSILFLTIILAFSACTKKDKQYVIGISQCSEDSWREKMNNEIKREAYLYDNIQLDIESRSEEHTSELQSPDHLVC